VLRLGVSRGEKHGQRIVGAVGARGHGRGEQQRGQRLGRGTARRGVGEEGCNLALGALVMKLGHTCAECATAHLPQPACHRPHATARHARAAPAGAHTPERLWRPRLLQPACYSPSATARLLQPATAAPYLVKRSGKRVPQPHQYSARTRPPYLHQHHSSPGLGFRV
jgi:hypothetical protein